MPSSHCLQINEIMKFITKTNPQKLLDIGVGFGKYGFLSREYLELWDGRQKYNDWKRTIDGIEVFKEYITPVHDLIYNKIFIGNAIDIVPTIEEKYDLILLIDVLEHFDYEVGLKLLQECDKHGRNILISVPKSIGSQGESFGNPYETHRFQWQECHFNKFDNKFVLPDDLGNSLIVYLGENYEDMMIMWEKKKKSFCRRVVVCMLNVTYLKEPIKRLLKKN